MYTYRKPLAALAGLMLLIAATRMHHFGSAVSLPDASLASFFLAGAALANTRRMLLPAFLLLCFESGAIDYFAITARGVSDWCISPAYSFLIPTYAVMHWAGYWLATQMSQISHRKAWLFGLPTAATSLAFMISSGSFYLFSGRYTEPSVTEYLERAGRYYPPYLAGTMMYLALAGLVLLAFSKWRAFPQASK